MRDSLVGSYCCEAVVRDRIRAIPYWDESWDLDRARQSHVTAWTHGHFEGKESLGTKEAGGRQDST